MSTLLALTILVTLALVAYNLLTLPLDQAAGVTVGIAAICAVQAWIYSAAASLATDGLGMAWEWRGALFMRALPSWALSP